MAYKNVMNKLIPGSQNLENHLKHSVIVTSKILDQ